MKGTKRVFKSALLTMFIFALSMLGVNALKMPNVNAAVIKPYPDNTMGLTVDYDRTDSELDITVTNGDGYQFQYWLKTKVATDNSGDPNKNKSQYIWQMVKGYLESSSSESIPVTADNLDEDERFNVIVRVKNGMVIEELYGAYTLSDLGVPVISFIAVNDKGVYESDVIINKSEAVTIKIFSNIAVDYALYYGDSQTPIGTAANGELGIISLDLSSATYKTGLHTFRAEITKGTVKDIKYFTVYAYEEYKSNEMPVITSLTGNDNGSGTSTFTMKVQFADGITIKDSEKDNFDYTLKSGPYDGTVKSITVNGDTLDVVFEVVYKNYDKNNKGTYETVGKVTRTGANAGDDKIIIYYTGYSQGGSLNLSSISDGSKYTITANGSINNVADSDLQYAFYREDASGWVLIRDYQTISDNPVKYNKLEWTPSKAGTYNIQARIKNTASVTWEKAVTKQYTVGSDALAGNVSVEIYDYEDYETGEPVTSGFIAGRPYMIKAVYTPTAAEVTANIQVLYMFTLTNKNLGTVYLNNYSPNSYYIFIPNKADAFEITARVINQSSFGFKDKAIDVDVIAETNINLAGENRMDLWSVLQEPGGFYYHKSSSGDDGIMFTSGGWGYSATAVLRLDSAIMNDAIEKGYTCLTFEAQVSGSSTIDSTPIAPVILNAVSDIVMVDELGRSYLKTIQKTDGYVSFTVNITGYGEYQTGTYQFGIRLGEKDAKVYIRNIKFDKLPSSLPQGTFDTYNFAPRTSLQLKHWTMLPPSKINTDNNVSTGYNLYCNDSGLLVLTTGNEANSLTVGTIRLMSSVINAAIREGYDTLSFVAAITNSSTTATTEMRPIKITGDTYEPIVDSSGNNYYTTFNKGVSTADVQFNISITNNGEYADGTAQFGIMSSSAKARLTFRDIYFTKSN